MAEPGPKKKRILSEETKKRKRESNRVKARSRVVIGAAFARWREVRDEEGFTTDAALAQFLLDSREANLKKTWMKKMRTKRSGSSEQQNVSSSLEQGEETNHMPDVKEEEEEYDVSKLSFSPVVVKNEAEEEPSTSSLTQHMKTETDYDNCGIRSESDVNQIKFLLPDHQRPLSSNSDTDDSEDWRETSNTHPDSNPERNPKMDVNGNKCDFDKSLICSGCGRKCSSTSGLSRHMRFCSGGLFICTVCGIFFKKRHALKVHMRLHIDGNTF